MFSIYIEKKKNNYYNYMPQLITLLYYYEYLLLLLIFAINFLLFIKYFISLLVKLVKLSTKSSILYFNLIYFIARNFIKAQNDLYSMNYIELSIFMYRLIS